MAFRNGVNGIRLKTVPTDLSPIQEEIVVVLRRTLLLALDDLVVVLEFLQLKLGRSSLQRLIKRHGVNNLNALIADQSGEQETPPPKTFKDYEPGYLHMDIKYLPMMPSDPHKRYLLVASSGATRWVYLKIVNDKTAQTAANFIEQVKAQYPFRINTLFTDNDTDFTNRFTRQGGQAPNAKH